MSSKPVPVIGPAPVFELTDLPIATVTLSGADSEPSSGATAITSWLWVLHSKPPGSAATLFNAETPEVQILDIDEPGSYLVSLQVTDDLGRSSHAGIEPAQSTSAPYAFSFPVTTSMAAVRVRSLSGLTKVAYGERQWLEHGLWPLIDRIDQNSSAIDSIASLGNGQIYADDIYEFTAGHEIHVHHQVNIDAITNLTDHLIISTSGVKDIRLMSSDDINIIAAGGVSISALASDISTTSVGNTEIATAGTDSYIRATFLGANYSKAVRLEGYPSSYSTKYNTSAGGSSFQQIGTEVDLALAGPTSASYYYDALTAGALLPNFSLQFSCAFGLEDFTAAAGKYIKLYFNVYRLSNSAKFRCLEITLMPDTTGLITEQSMTVTGFANSIGKNTAVTATATLNLSDSTSIARAGYGIGSTGTAGFFEEGFEYAFGFSAESNSTTIPSLRNLSSVFNLLRRAA